GTDRASRRREQHATTSGESQPSRERFHVQKPLLAKSGGGRSQGRRTADGVRAGRTAHLSTGLTTTDTRSVPVMNWVMGTTWRRTELNASGEIELVEEVSRSSAPGGRCLATWPRKVTPDSPVL